MNTPSFARPSHPLFNLITTFKLCLALLLGFILTLAFPFVKSQWILITIAIISNSSNTTSLQTQAAFQRIIGTLAGVLMAIISLALPSNSYFFLLSLMITAFFFSLYGQAYPKFHYVSTLGIVTFCILTIYRHQSLSIISLRSLDILCGVLISLSVSRFVFPMTSETMVNHTIAELKQTIKLFNNKIFIEKKERRNNPEFTQLDSQIAALLSKARTIIDSTRFDRKQTDQLPTLTTLRYLRACYQYLIFIETATHELALLKDPQHTAISNALTPFATVLSDILDSKNNNEALEAELKNKANEFKKSSTLDNLEKVSGTQHQHAITYALERIIFCISKMPS